MMRYCPPPSSVTPSDNADASIVSDDLVTERGDVTLIVAPLREGLNSMTSPPSALWIALRSDMASEVTVSAVVSTTHTVGVA